MSQFKKIGGFGLWKKNGQDGSTYYAGKFKLDLTKLEGDPEPNTELFFSLSQSQKRHDNSPDLWVTVKVKEDEGYGGSKNEQPPPQEQDQDIPF